MNAHCPTCGGPVTVTPGLHYEVVNERVDPNLLGDVRRMLRDMREMSDIMEMRLALDHERRTQA
jgi:hypothetical protein